MVDFILTMIFIFTVLCIWLLRYWRLREIEKLENASQEEKKAVVTIVPDELTNVRINNEPVNVQIQSATHSLVQNNTYPDSDIETAVPLVASNTNSDSLSYDVSVAFTDDNGNDIYEEKPVEIIVGDEIPTNDELVNELENKVTEDVSEYKTVLDSSIDYASISDYFSGKLDTIKFTDTEEKTVDSSISAEEDFDIEVFWSGENLIEEKNSRTVILADEMTPGEAYVYYRQNLVGETFKGFIIADNQSADDYNKGVVRARYARQAINGEYKRGFIIRSADISLLKFYTATKDEIADFLGRRPEEMRDLDNLEKLI